MGSGATIGDGTDALNASLSSDIVSSTPFLLELMDVNVPTDKGDMLTLETYLDSQSSPWWNYIIGIPGLVINGVKSLFTDEMIILMKQVMELLNLLKKKAKR